MNTNVLIGALVVIVVLLIGGGYVAYTTMYNDAPKEQSTPTPQANNGLQPSESFSGTFATLLGLGQNLRCEFQYNDGTNVSSGTTYIAQGGERIRGDFSIADSATGPMEAHLIRDSGYNYVWGTMIGQGIKMKIAQGDEDELFASDSGNMPVDENTEYTCTPWSVDQSMFTVPSDVEFIDLSVQMERMMQLQESMDTSGLKAQQCAACDQIPDAGAKAQCKAALQC